MTVLFARQKVENTICQDLSTDIGQFSCAATVMWPCALAKTEIVSGIIRHTLSIGCIETDYSIVWHCSMYISLILTWHFEIVTWNQDDCVASVCHVDTCALVYICRSVIQHEGITSFTCHTTITRVFEHAQIWDWAIRWHPWLLLTLFEFDIDR